MATPRLRYQTLEFSRADIHVCTLRDTQQFHDPDEAASALGISPASWPHFGVVWPSGLALARLMDDYIIAGKRILEIGCGIGLPSLLLNSRDADITATDHHPEAEEFLHRNTLLNEAGSIAFERTGWSDEDDDLGGFDLIIGSDLLYEDEHVALLANFIDAHANANCEVLIVDPGRGRKSRLATMMTGLGFASSCRTLPHGEDSPEAFKGFVLRFER